MMPLDGLPEELGSETSIPSTLGTVYFYTPLLSSAKIPARS